MLIETLTGELVEGPDIACCRKVRNRDEYEIRTTSGGKFRIDGAERDYWVAAEAALYANARLDMAKARLRRRSWPVAEIRAKANAESAVVIPFDKAGGKAG